MVIPKPSKADLLQVKCTALVSLYLRVDGHCEEQTRTTHTVCRIGVTLPIRNHGRLGARKRENWGAWEIQGRWKWPGNGRQAETQTRVEQRLWAECRADHTSVHLWLEKWVQLGIPYFFFLLFGSWCFLYCL